MDACRRQHLISWSKFSLSEMKCTATLYHLYQGVLYISLMFAYFILRVFFLFQNASIKFYVQIPSWYDLLIIMHLVWSLRKPLHPIPSFLEELLFQKKRPRQLPSICISLITGIDFALGAARIMSLHLSFFPSFLPQCQLTSGIWFWWFPFSRFLSHKPLKNSELLVFHLDFG